MFKTGKNRRFNYKPIFYDKQKADREKQKKRIQIEREGKIMKNASENWDKIPYSTLAEQGKRRVLFLVVLISVFLIFFYKILDKIDLLTELFLNG